MIDSDGDLALSEAGEGEVEALIGTDVSALPLLLGVELHGEDRLDHLLLVLRREGSILVEPKLLLLHVFLSHCSNYINYKII